MLESELTGISSVLPEIFGYYIAQIGGPSSSRNDILATSKIHNHIIVNPTSSISNDSLAIRCDLDELPFLPESLDAVVMMHVLEFAENPKAILNELYASLIQGGYLVILGFNPYSLWGVTKLLKHTKKGIWSGNWLRPAKLRFWLNKIGFEVGDYQTFYFRPPNAKTKKMFFVEGLGQLFWSYCGASYMLIAKKTSIIVTPIHQTKSLIKQTELVKGLPKPTSRVSQ